MMEVASTIKGAAHKGNHTQHQEREKSYKEHLGHYVNDTLCHQDKVNLKFFGSPDMPFSRSCPGKPDVIALFTSLRWCEQLAFRLVEARYR